MLPWLAILLSSLLPNDLVALILRPELTVAEDAPTATVIGRVVPFGGETAEIEMVAALPEGVVNLDPETSLISVAESRTLDFESSRRVVLILREAHLKPSDPYRSLFVDHLLRNGAHPRHLERFTTQVRYRILVVGVTDVDERTAVVDAGLPRAKADDHPVNLQQVISNALRSEDTPEGLAPMRRNRTFEIEQLAEIQAYLDRTMASVASSMPTSPEPAVTAVTVPEHPVDSTQGEALSNASNGMIASNDIEEAPTTGQVEQPVDALATQTQTPMPVTEHHVRGRVPASPVDTKPLSHPHQSAQAATGAAVGKQERSVGQRGHHLSTVWWIAGIVPLFPLVCFCLVFAWNVLKHVRQLSRWSGCFNHQQMATGTAAAPELAALAEDKVYDASDVLDEYDLALLRSWNNGSTSEDATALMKECLTAWENLGAPDEALELTCEQELGVSRVTRSDVLDQELEPVAVCSLVETTQVCAASSPGERSLSLREATASLTSAAALQTTTIVRECETSLTIAQTRVETNRPSEGPAGDGFRLPDSSINANAAAGTYSLSEVERLRKLIRDEFGIEVTDSPDGPKRAAPPSGTGKSAQKSKPSVKRDPPPLVDLGEFREISETAFRQAIETSKASVRHRRFHHLLNYTAIGCSLVGGVAVAVSSSETRIHVLLVSVSALAVSGYLISGRPSETDA